MLFLLPLPLPACKRADSFANYNTQENRPCIFSGQHNGAGPVDKGTVNHPENLSLRDLTLYLNCHMTALAGKRSQPVADEGDDSPPLLPTVLRKVGPVPSLGDTVV